MSENDITKEILDAAIKIHKRFGPGMLESVYEQLLAVELIHRGHKVERQKGVSFEYEGVKLDTAFRLDMLVDDTVIVELKSTEHMQPVYLKQVKTYLAVMGLQVGVLVNFGMSQLKDGYVRIVNGYTGPKPSQQ